MENYSLQESTDKLLRVLIADDDAPTRILLRTAISQWGYEVVEARDGEEAWNELQKQNAPRLLILDWLMPKIDGITLCERCKSQIINNQPYIIMLTQVSGNDNIVKGIEAGADEFLSKPFNMAELRSRLSIGSKIVSYGNEILKKTMELHSYQKRVNIIISEISKLTEQANTVVINTANPELQELLSKINLLTKELTQLNIKYE